MSMAYIRKTYGVPAKRGRVVEVWEVSQPIDTGAIDNIKPG